MSRFDSVGCSWRYCQTIREACEREPRVLENMSQSVLVQLYLTVLEWVVQVLDSAKISKVLLHGLNQLMRCHPQQFVTESWIAWDVKARSHRVKTCLFR